MQRFSGGRYCGRCSTGARQDGPLKANPIRVDFLRSPTIAPNTLLVARRPGW